MLQTPDGDLWLGTENGITRISAPALQNLGWFCAMIKKGSLTLAALDRPSVHTAIQGHDRAACVG